MMSTSQSHQKWGDYRYMLQKFKLIASVLAINSKGDTSVFQLEKPVPAEIEPTETEKDLFFGEKFRGRKGDNDPCEFIVIKVINLECIPEPFYMSVIDSGALESHGFIRLGNYDIPDDLDLMYRKHPLTRLTVRFEMKPGEGLIFNLRNELFGTRSKFRWTKRDYVITSSNDEIWMFPNSGWELHVSPISDVDYVKAGDFRDSLPEITSW